MKKLIPILFLFLLSLFSVDSASRFNEGRDSSGYYSIGHFQVREVRAHRAITEGDGIIAGLVGEEEDHWKIYYAFTDDVTNFRFKWTALDGVNDHDTRSFSHQRDERSANDEADFEDTDFPTFVDNMQVEIQYDLGGQTYDYIFFIYVQEAAGIDTGSSPLDVGLTIPNASIDTDGSGSWDGDKGLGQILQFVKAPYDLLMWFSDVNNQVTLGMGILIMFISVFIGLRLPATIAWVMLIPFFVGAFFFMGGIFSALGII